jgi:hypothetical protein
MTGVVTEILGFLFGSRWWIIWHVALWLGALLFVIMPLAMLAGDALKVPQPTASLGTMAYMMFIVLFLAVITLINGTMFLRPLAVGVGSGILFVLALAALVTMLSSMSMLQMLGSAPRVAVTFAWTSSAAFFLGNLVMARLAATRPPDSISLGPNWVIGLVCAAIVLLGLLVFGVIPFDPTAPKPGSSNWRQS